MAARADLTVEIDRGQVVSRDLVFSGALGVP
jgi:hypothetical protein